MKDVSDIYRIATRNLTRGQDVYAEEFVRSVNDPRINTELARLFKRAEPHHGDDVVEVPARLLLAVLLREGGRRPKPDINIERHLNENAVQGAEKRKAELIANGMRPGRAHEQAAQEAKAEWKCRISISTIIDRMGRPRSGRVRIIPKEWAKLR